MCILFIAGGKFPARCGFRLFVFVSRPRKPFIPHPQPPNPQFSPIPSCPFQLLVHLSSPHLRFLCVFCIPVVLPGHPGHLYRNPEGACGRRFRELRNRRLRPCGRDSSPNILLSTFNRRLLTSPRGSFFASSRPALPFTSALVLRMRCSRLRRFLSESPAFDFQLSTVNLPARVFLRFLTSYLAVHEYLSSPHAVQPSAQIPLRTFYFRLSTVDC